MRPKPGEELPPLDDEASQMSEVPATPEISKPSSETNNRELRSFKSQILPLTIIDFAIKVPYSPASKRELKEYQKRLENERSDQIKMPMPRPRYNYAVKSCTKPASFDVKVPKNGMR